MSAVTSLHFMALLIWRLYNMHLPSTFCHSATWGAWEESTSWVDLAVELGLTQHFLHIRELLHQDPSLHTLGTLHPVLFYVPTVTTSTISHETFIHVSGGELIWVRAVSCLVPKCLSYFFRNGHADDIWVRDKPPSSWESRVIGSCACLPHTVLSTLSHISESLHRLLTALALRSQPSMVRTSPLGVGVSPQKKQVRARNWK